uniref:Uncharacterized protein n=1 Tax=Medicago truncatula TaxID=3880 RepID=I3SC28_MEDTR|nr:unknown [Medicago truncatula]
MILQDSCGRESNSPQLVKPMPRSVFAVCGRMKLSSRLVPNQLLQQVLLPVPTMLQRVLKLKGVHLKVVPSVFWVYISFCRSFEKL